MEGQIEPRKYHVLIDWSLMTKVLSGINSAEFTCRAYNAGHVLGAAMFMFMIEIAGVRVLYTGDFSREEDRHLMAAELPSASVRPGNQRCRE